MNEQLKIKKDINGSALIDLGQQGSLTFEQVTVYSNDEKEKDLVLLIVDKNNPNNKIQLTFNKASDFTEEKDPAVS